MTTLTFRKEKEVISTAYSKTQGWLEWLITYSCLLYSKLPMMNVLKIAVQISTYPSEGLKAIAFGISSFPSISRTILQLRKSPR